MTCGCDDKCELPKALQINNPGEVTLFHRVEIPASQGDDETYPPKNGLYRNVLLVYLANNHSYLYSSDGIPTKIEGPQGEPGEAATIEVGTTTTGEPGTDASVVNSGTSSAAVFDFVIPKGDKGDTGPAGKDGADGFSPIATVSKAGDTATITITDKNGTTTSTITDGADGAAATISVGTTSTLPAGSSATVTNSGTSSAAVFDFGIPKGDKGDTGATGAAATIAVGTTSTLTPGSSATVTNSGTSSAAIFNFGIPKGEKGDTGATGAGVASGGTSGQILAKASNTDYDTTWVNAPSSELVEMVYGESNAWAKFIAAYNAHNIVYCRASSNADPSSGAKTRRAFMAYVNNETTPTEVEFQYVRSVSSKSASQQCDQVFVYKLTSANGGTWTVQTRDMASKVVAGTNMTSSYSGGTLTLNATDTTYSDFTGATSSVAGAHGLVPAPTTSDPDKFLKGDGTWGTPPGTTYTEGTGIDITGSTISVDTSTVAMQSDLPTKTSDLINDGSDSTSTYVEADELATVATSGSYSDLLNKPTIPTVNDATLTIQKNGTDVQTFTANSSSNKTANITVPTKTSDLTNDGSDNTSTYVEADELATVATSGSYTDLTNKPTIPTINRFTKSLYNSTANSWYYPIATLPIDNSGNYCSVIVDGRIGGWVDSNMAKLDLIFTNRDGYTGDTVAAAGSIKGAYSNALNLCNVVVYKQTDKSAIAYLKCDGYFTFDVEVKYFQATSAWTGNYTTSPSGTLIWSTKTTSSLEYVDQSGKISKVREVYNHFTTRPASANLAHTGNGGMFTFQATGTMTTGKPKNDSHILQLEWDNDGGWDSQIAVNNNGNSPWIATRAQNAGTWGDWVYLLNDVAGSVKTTNIDALAVTTAKIDDGAVTADKIASGVIPTVNDATLTITQNGVSAGTFTANASSNTTIALTDTTYSAFVGATSSVAGSAGLVPAPTTSDPDKYLKGDGTWGTPAGGGGSPTGTISMFAGSTAPTGYLICDGSAVSRTTYADLFTVISTTYGTGDGSTTFNLPNLKGKVPVGQDTSDTSFDVLGETGGEKTHKLTVAEMPSHTHRLSCQRGTPGNSSWDYAQPGTGWNASAWNPNPTEPIGGNGYHNNLQPYIVLNYIIKI